MDILLKIGTEVMNIYLPEPNLRLVLKDIRAVLRDMRGSEDTVDACSRLCLKLYHNNPSLHVGLRRSKDTTLCVCIDVRERSVQILYNGLSDTSWEFAQFAQLSDQDLRRLTSKCLAALN